MGWRSSYLLPELDAAGLAGAEDGLDEAAALDVDEPPESPLDELVLSVDFEPVSLFVSLLFDPPPLLSALFDSPEAPPDFLLP